MPFKAQPLTSDVEERKRIHAVFNDWLCLATEEEFQQLEQTRERFAPHQVCSIVSLIRGCLVQKELVQSLPASLRQLQQARNLPPVCADAKAL